MKSLRSEHMKNSRISLMVVIILCACGASNGLNTNSTGSDELSFSELSVDTSTNTPDPITTKETATITMVPTPTPSPQTTPTPNITPSVDPTPLPSYSPETVQEGEIRYIVRVDTSVYLRKAADNSVADDNIITYIPVLAKVLQLRQEGFFSLVEYNGIKGYVKSEYLAATPFENTY